MYINHRTNFGTLQDSEQASVSVQAQAQATPLDVVKADHPLIHLRIVSEWGTQGLNDALSKMLLAESTDAKTFSPKVAMALMTLLEVHERKFGFTSTLVFGEVFGKVKHGW